MLITRPNHDVTTNYLYYWCTILINHSKKQGRQVVDLVGRRANRREFESIIEKTKPSFVVLNGHGDANTVTGYDNMPLLQSGKNEKCTNKKVLFARSCGSAKTLGHNCVTSGCNAYIGYDDDFVFVTEDAYVSRPLSDPTAALFLEPSNQIVTSLLKGHSVNEANIRSKEMYKRNIQKLTVSVAS